MNTVRYFRRKVSRKYGHRFIQGVDFEEIRHPKFKYCMVRDRAIQTRVTGYHITTQFFILYTDGRLIIHRGYAWDGPSGPTIDTASFMRSSAVHDALFQMLREVLIPARDWRVVFDLANTELRRLSKIDGMLWPRYHFVKTALDIAGAKHAKPRSA